MDASAQNMNNASYPLSSKWTLWYNGPKQNDMTTTKHQWLKRFKKITDFDTVESFWRLFNNLSPPSVLPSGSDFHLFKGGIEPEWESEGNVGGGTWTYRMHVKDTNGIDQAWFQLVLLLVGNTFLHVKHVTGVVVSIRKSNARLSVWTSKLNPDDPSERASIMGIGNQIREKVDAKQKSLTFITHDDAKEGNKNKAIEL